MRSTTTVLAATALAAAAGTASAQVVFEQLPDQSNAYRSDAGGNLPSFRAADFFTLGSNTSIGTVEFWGTNTGGQPLTDSFTINFYADDNGLPGALLSTELVGAVDVVTTGEVIAGVFPEYLYTAELAVPMDATAGTGYLLSIVNDSNASPTDSWFWEFSASAPVLGAVTPDFGASWGPSPSSFAFRLSAIPTPASATLLGIGGLAATRCRR